MCTISGFAYLSKSAKQPVQPDAVVGDVDVRVGLLAMHEGEPAAQAVAHGAGLAVGARQRAGGGERRLQVLDPLVLVECLQQRERLVPLRLATCR